MTTVTVHNPDVTVTPAQHPQHQPTIQTQPSMAPLPVSFDQQTSSAAIQPGYPLGGMAAPPRVTAPSPFPETPTQVAVNAGSKTMTVQDSLGRIIKVKKIGAGDRMRLMRHLGGELADNGPYLGHCMLAAGVREIDGEPIPFTTNPRHLEDLVDRLEDDGLGAIADGMKEAGWIKVQSDKELLDEAKN